MAVLLQLCVALFQLVKQLNTQRNAISTVLRSATIYSNFILHTEMPNTWQQLQSLNTEHEFNEIQTTTGVKEMGPK